MKTVTDESWAAVARTSRDALRYLGHDIAPRCLPGEPDECGGSFAQHAGAHLITARAVIDHQLAHLGLPEATMSVMYAGAAAEADCGRLGCEQEQS